jgi:hypothetical protein
MEILYTTVATMTFQLALCFLGFLIKTGAIQGLGDMMNVNTKDNIESTKPNINIL